MINQGDCYFLGKIVKRHGLSGHVVLKLDTDQPEYYKKMESIFIEINGALVPFFIENQKNTQSDFKILLLKGINQTTIDQIIGKNVYLPLRTLPKLTGNQFYYHEVIGFSVFSEMDGSCGRIESVNDDAPQHYFILNSEGKEVIIPIIKDWILNVDRENKQIEMSLPNGLIDIFR